MKLINMVNMVLWLPIFALVGALLFNSGGTIAAFAVVTSLAVFGFKR